MLRALIFFLSFFLSFCSSLVVCLLACLRIHLAFPLLDLSQARVVLSFMEAAHGATRALHIVTEVVCDTCAGSGCKPGTGPTVCKTCKGTGQVDRKYMVSSSCRVGSLSLARSVFLVCACVCVRVCVCV